jgi:hypothetical protein
MADKPCVQCQHYDPIIRGLKTGKHGWCAVKSAYPAAEQPGQIFPPGVARVEPGELARPVIVVGRSVVPGCVQFRALAPVAVKKSSKR